MKSLSLILALVVIASLNVILFWGAGSAGEVVGSNAMFGILVFGRFVMGRRRKVKTD